MTSRPTHAQLRRRGVLLEVVTLSWNIAGVIVLAVAALAARSVALAGFGLDSLIEIGASTVVIWELSGRGRLRQATALRIIAAAFVLLACYLGIQSTFVLAAGKEKTGRRLDNRVLRAEGRVTFVDGLLATAVLAGLALNTTTGWWWADPLAGYVILIYGIEEGSEALHHAARPAAAD
jgi:divalent metal cation (Fe/Co/Zn/Cd) transporter